MNASLIFEFKEDGIEICSNDEHSAKASNPITDNLKSYKTFFNKILYFYLKLK